jgi:N4-gp56 family major capsid protein
LTTPAVNNEYDWNGVNTVNIYSIPTVAMTDYEMSGTARYGSPDELNAGVQTLTLRRDRAFTFTIDRRNFESNMMVTEAGKALARQVDEVVIPEIEGFCINRICSGAGLQKQTPITSDNAYDCFLEANTAMTENKVPIGGRVALITPKFYKAIKLDPSFMRSCDIAQDMLVTGQVGMVDGVKLILVPTNYFPSTVMAFVLVHPSAVVSPVKLCEYKIHDNPPGINGWLVEGRIVFDTYVLESKKNGVYLHVDQ